MVVLAACIATRGGKPVISRQFREMPSSRIETLLASFPKLITSGSQHTFVETDSVRFVYQPLEDLYMILITTKNSNILQDIDSLHLFARAVSDRCHSLDEQDIFLSCFDILEAIDEIVSLGYRENVTLSQIRTMLEMDSHEERIHDIIERNKELEAKEELKRRARQLEMQRRDAARRNQSGFSNDMSSMSRTYDTAPTAPVYGMQDTTAQQPIAPTTQTMPLKGKGMSLGKKPKGSALLGSVPKAGGVPQPSPVGQKQAGTVLSKARSVATPTTASNSAPPRAPAKRPMKAAVAAQPPELAPPPAPVMDESVQQPTPATANLLDEPALSTLSQPVDAEVQAVEQTDQAWNMATGEQTDELLIDPSNEVEAATAPVMYEEQVPNDKAYDEHAYNEQAYDEQAYDEQAYDERAYNEQTYDEQAYDEQAYNEQAYNEQAYIEQAYNEQAYNEQAYDEQAYNEQAYDEQAYNERALQPDYTYELEDAHEPSQAFQDEAIHHQEQALQSDAAFRAEEAFQHEEVAQTQETYEQMQAYQREKSLAHEELLHKEEEVQQDDIQEEQQAMQSDGAFRAEEAFHHEEVAQTQEAYEQMQVYQKEQGSHEEMQQPEDLFQEENLSQNIDSRDGVYRSEEAYPKASEPVFGGLVQEDVAQKSEPVSKDQTLQSEEIYHEQHPVETAHIEKTQEIAERSEAPVPAPAEVAVEAPGPVLENVHFTIKERVSASVNRDGGTESLEVKGDLLLKITDASATRLNILMDAHERFHGAEVQYRTHPHVDKQPWASERRIALRDPKREFPLNQQVGVLRWRAVTKDDSALPLSITVWVSPSGDGASEVNVEYQLENTSLTLSDVVIAIPVPSGAQPEVADPEYGTHEYDAVNNYVLWRVPSISSASISGNLELSVLSGAESADVFFPVSVDFNAQSILLRLQILSVMDALANISRPFSQEALLVADNYLVH